MKKPYTYRRGWMVVAFVGLSLAAGIGVGRIEPSGRNAGVVQFDAISELKMDGSPFCVVFARYWVCSEFYAISVVWTEPRGGGILIGSTVIFSDENGFRIEDPSRSQITAFNSTYVKPLGEKGLYRNMGVPFEFQDIRFTEADALSRRVYVSDLASLNEANRQVPRTVNLKVPAGAAGRERKLAELTVQAQGRRIESMELFDTERRSLGQMKYEYDAKTDAPRLSRLLAELPPRPVRLEPDDNGPEIDYFSHKGGRTCSVVYQDVTIGGRTLRLPTQIEVRHTADKQLLRSARLMNFKGVDLDKAGVLEAARDFSRLDSKYPVWGRIVDKYLHHQPRLGPPSADPNDLDFVRQLLAKYPVPQLPAPPLLDEPRGERLPGPQELGYDEWIRQQRMRSEARREEAMKRARLAQMMPRPQPRDIEPNDARLMRQLSAYYRRVLHPPMTEEERAEFRAQGWFVRQESIPEDKREISDLCRQLVQVLTYHRAPILAEDRAPELDADDRQLISQLREHYEKLASQTERGLGGQLRTLHCLIRLDEILEDYDAYERHTLRYLRLLEEADLFAMYMTGGCQNIETLVAAGQYTRANRLLRQWADKSAAENDPEAIFHFARAVFGGESNPWASVHLLERFLRRSDLSALQRYEGLALRAIALDKIDKMPAGLETIEDESRQAQARWILSTTTRTELSRRTESAVRQAFQAWESLGPARLSEAKPYATAGASAWQMNMTGSTEATALQETSAQLDRIIRERSGQTPGPQPRTPR